MKKIDELKALQEIENATKYQIKEVDLGNTVLKTFDDLENHVLKNKIEGKELDDLILSSTGAISDSSIGTAETLNKVKEFIEQWPIRTTIELPIFIS